MRARGMTRTAALMITRNALDCPVISFSIFDARRRRLTQQPAVRASDRQARGMPGAQLLHITQRAGE
jgi:hypothetical protein